MYIHLSLYVWTHHEMPHSDVTGPPPNHRPITGHCPVVLAAILQLNLGGVICFTRALETWRKKKQWSRMVKKCQESPFLSDFWGQSTRFNKYKYMASMASMVPTHQPDIVDILDIGYVSIEHGHLFMVDLPSYIAWVDLSISGWWLSSTISAPGNLWRIPFWDPSAHPRLLFVSSLPSCGCFTCVRNHTELHTSASLPSPDGCCLVSSLLKPKNIPKTKKQILWNLQNSKKTQNSFGAKTR